MTTFTAGPLARLIRELEKLPGIGPKSAQRLAYFLLRAPQEQVRELSQALLEVKQRIITCSACQDLTDQDPCAICRDESRDRGTICVVEEPLDRLALERSGSYRGLYHVLHGALTPMEGIGPEDIKVQELLDRVKASPPGEVILATNPNLEGEATAMYLGRLLLSLGLRVTRLAYGLPMGADLEYADDLTLALALEGRREVQG
ncbi:MAG TPA: recombination mediator RecR [Dehalococcoidia bacterium]|nr:recombination mediator RecR [Dehalococcoidia bacterium]HLB28550.1 recombination mediator RecR [Dehalococcoidia bacterium]